jgi:hypothetical protein
MATSNPRDHALIVGISRYVGLPAADGKKPSVLEGPVSDAKAIFAWLVDPSGGGLNETNIEIIHSDQFPPADDPAIAAPAYNAVREGLSRLITKTKNNRARRLYIYMSGHGFAPQADRGALLTAECDDPSLPNIYASEWLDRLRGLACFEEFVLWMDCCFENTDSIPFEAPPVRKPPLAGPSGLRFIGLAAQTGMRALECAIEEDGNRVHGVFTWTLLSGLRGGASRDPATGQITGEGLRDYLLAAMKTFIPAARLAARDVSATPYAFADAGLLFGAPKVAPKFSVVFNVRAPDAQPIVVRTGTPPREVCTAFVAGGAANVALEPGVYVAEANGLRGGFDVTAEAKAVTLAEPLPPASATTVDGQFLLSVGCVTSENGVEVDELGAVLTLVDSQFKRLLTSLGSLRATFQPGVYKLVAQFGADVLNKVERVVLLDRNLEGLKISAPSLLSPAPLAGTSPTHEYHQRALEGLQPNAAPWIAAARTRAPISVGLDELEERTSGDIAEVSRGGLPQAPLSSAIGVLARFWTGQPAAIQEPNLFPNPFNGLSIVDVANSIVIDLSNLAYQPTSDPVVSHVVDVVPGTYVLRQKLRNGAVFDRPVVASPNWQTNVVIRRDPRDIGVSSSLQLSCMGAVSLHMAYVGATPLDPLQAPSFERQIEGWRLALRDRRRISSVETRRLLESKFDNPILGIIGAHLALLSEPQPALGLPDRTWLTEVVDKMRSLVGPSHPDVEALALLCPDRAITVGAISAPPMYLRSWEIMAEQAEDPETLFPTDAWWRSHRRAFDSLYLVWIATPTEASSKESSAGAVTTLEIVPAEL